MLSDLIPEVTKARMPRQRRISATAAHMRWVAKNRDRWNAYRRDWYARRKA